MSLPSVKGPNDFPFKHSGNPDQYGQSVGGNVGTVQTNFDSRAEYNQTQINSIITALASTTLGDDGAKAIGLKLNEITANNVNGAILELYNAIVGIVQNPLVIPPNSILNSQLVTDAKVGSLALLSTTVKTDVVSAINEVETTAEGSIQKSIVDATGDLIKGTGADTVARLPRGTANQVLAVNGGGTDIAWTTLTTDDGAWKKIAEVNPSGVSSISFNSISTTYEFFKIVWHATASGGNGSELLIQFNSDAGSNYSVEYNSLSGTGATIGSLSTASTITAGIISYNASRSGGSFEITNPTSQHKTLFGISNGQYNGTTPYAIIGGGVWKNTSKITSITLLAGGGATMSGKFELWGAL